MAASTPTTPSSTLITNGELLAAKTTACVSIPTTAVAEPVDDELKTTKDNLKSFIERWEEHPNSPYVFDAVVNQISPVTLADEKRMNGSGGGGGSVLSSRGTFDLAAARVCVFFFTLQALGWKTLTELYKNFVTIGKAFLPKNYN